MRAPAPPGVGERMALEVLGAGRVSAAVERVEELVQEGVRGLAWRVTLRLPDGSRAHGIQRGNARVAFPDPRHSAASGGPARARRRPTLSRARG